MLTRRELIQLLSLLGFSAAAGRSLASSTTEPLISKPIPKTGELLPVMGVGTARTFDKVTTEESLKRLLPVLETFFQQGGALIDSSPMYGKAEQFTGDLIKQMQTPPKPFVATKVWTTGKQKGIDQMQRSFNRMGVETMDLMQIHNLKDWQIHIKTLREMKEKGSIRYIGITTSHGRNHDALEAVLKKEAFDFVQLSYSIGNRAVENRLLPLAADKGIAVIANRNFQRGELFSAVKGRSLPEFAKELGCSSWAQFFLKYVVSHPAVTCAIPATSKVKYMLDNMQAGLGVLPDLQQRKAMESFFSAL